MQTKILPLNSSRIFGSLEKSRGCWFSRVTKCRPSLLWRGAEVAPGSTRLLHAGLRSDPAAAGFKDGAGAPARRPEHRCWGLRRKGVLPLTECPRSPGHSLPKNTAGQGPVAHLRHSYCPMYVVGSSYLKVLQQKGLSSHQNLSRLTLP